jgi:hypothetical protein
VASPTESIVRSFEAFVTINLSITIINYIKYLIIKLSPIKLKPLKIEITKLLSNI